MAFHLHQILDIVVSDNKNLEEAINRYEDMLGKLEHLCIDETQEALTRVAKVFTTSII